LQLDFAPLDVAQEFGAAELVPVGGILEQPRHSLGQQPAEVHAPLMEDLEETVDVFENPAILVMQPKADFLLELLDEVPAAAAGRQDDGDQILGA
jgi:hypothetical protein